MEEPIATYREARLELRRRFELYADRVRVVGSGLGIGRFDAVVPLATLRPIPSRQWVRGRLFRWGLIALFTAAMFAVGAFGSGGPDALLRPWTFAVVGSLSWIGLLLAATGVRPTEFVSFPNAAGGLGLDVARAGPDAAEFETFVDLLIEHIRQAGVTT